MLSSYFFNNKKKKIQTKNKKSTYTCRRNINQKQEFMYHDFYIKNFFLMSFLLGLFKGRAGRNVASCFYKSHCSLNDFSLRKAGIDNFVYLNNGGKKIRLRERERLFPGFMLINFYFYRFRLTRYGLHRAADHLGSDVCCGSA